MFKQYSCLLFFGLVFNSVIISKSEIAENSKNKMEVKYLKMAPNSKFLNPFLDDATNLKFAIAAFGNDQWNTEKGEITIETDSTASEIPNTITPKHEMRDSRMARYLKDWSIPSLIRSKISQRNKKL